MAETNMTMFTTRKEDTGTQEEISPQRLRMEQDLRAYDGWLRSLDERVENGSMSKGTRRRLIALALLNKDRRKEREQKKNERDPMTKLYRQEHLRPKLENMIREGKPFAVLFTDLDKFGQINKQYGQPAGDEVMIQSALRITEQLREDDFPYRNGGDETAIILPGIDNPEDLHAVAEKIRTSIQSAQFYIPISDTGINLTISIGGCIWNGGNTEQFMDVVAKNLLEAKGKRNKVAIK